MTKPKKKFRPNSPHQLEFIKQVLDPENDIVVLLSGRQAGKSWAGAAAVGGLIFNTERCRNGVGWCVAYNYPQSQAAQEAFLGVFGWKREGGMVIEHLVSKNAYILYTGRGHGRNWNCGKDSCKGCYRVEFKSAEEPDSLRGRAIDFLWFDEAALLQEYAYTTTLGVLLTTGGPILCTTTPKSKNWFYDKIFMESLKNPRIKFIRATTDDNPDRNLRMCELIKNQYSGIQYQQEILGEFKTLEGLIYPFDEDKHCFDEKYPLPPGEWLAGVDFGFNPDPFCYIWILKGQDGIYYACDELYKTNVTIDSLAAMIKQNPLEPKISRRYADPSRPDLRAIMDKARIGTWMAKNDIDAGINIVANLFDKGRLKISRKCINGVRELSNYQAKKNGKGPQDKDNHFCDALRYALATENWGEGGDTFAITYTHDDGSVTIVNDGENGEPDREHLDPEEIVKRGRANGEFGWSIDGVEQV